MQFVNELNTDQFIALLDQLRLQTAELEPDNRRLSLSLAAIAQRAKSDSSDDQDAMEVAQISHIYQQLGPPNTTRYHLLNFLARKATSVSLKMLSKLLIDDPPHGVGPNSAAILPLFQLTEPNQLAAIFPDILDAISNPELAASILDLANFLTRRERIAPHPAVDRVDELNQLAEAIAAMLDTFQTSQPTSAEDLRLRQEKVANGIPLAVSLCDALAFIGDERSIPVLERLLELKHRRLRVEAAAALIRLDQEPATQVLCDMAAEPSVRSRVIAYAEELEIMDSIDPEFRTPVAIAEADLITFLSDPTNMGLPPANCELMDASLLSWPGYEEPRNCYLFRYSYDIVDANGQPATFSNVGIAGPLAHTFHADLSQLPTADIYAAFAGWQAEHEEINEQPLQHRTMQPQVVQDFVERLEKEDYDEIQPLVLGNFFQDQVLVTLAKRESTAGTVIVDQARSSWFPQSSSDRGIGPAEAYAIYKGRRLLRSFNDDLWDE
ncbi:MAG: HEAT repeat domain-containing protein, partial [Planctomycetota bacterium]